ncbi:MAG TPA: S24/S26 family peptidase [Planctomycetota bacterium]|nr:S24/S26 family peptidase [Planctomycetota bacterium]
MATNNYTLIKAAGSSMRPSIINGDCVVVKHCSLGDSRIGDIVAVNNRDSLCIHRLVWKSRAKLVIKGDSISSFGVLTIGENNDFVGKVINVTRNDKIIVTERQCGNIIRLFISLCLIPWQIIRRH